ncbi:MAG TPA: nickel-binding protein [Ornithinimicrobium sp.]|uniref:nickel-binding protein n=1 Tax=Ornithinimicrobium sp. TaxID=1977084 RepID=UPI002B47C0E4|nr:nickel-binding protein [Ornithinimicrobium sp.]HKJ11043.1 nickel-binding protein [Ornithinimicrobium sp.]
MTDRTHEGMTAMPLFMDVHENVDGLTQEAVEQAHHADLETQERHGVHFRRYWYDAASGSVFCLVEAPSAEAAEAVHREAHGLVADRVVPVTEGS